LEKVRAISAALDVQTLRETVETLDSLDSLLRSGGYVAPDIRAERLSQLGPLSLSQPGSFVAPSSLTYEAAIEDILRRLVDPEPAQAKFVRKRTRLLSLVKTALRHERVLGKPGDDLSSHRVVPGVYLAEGLVADFVLQNGALHVLETVDASSTDISPKRIIADVAVSALVLEQARMTFGPFQTTSRLIYEASNEMEKVAMPSLLAAAHQGAELVNWRSDEERRSLLVHLSKMATPLPAKGRARTASFTSSTQPKLNLN
jgi:hypothetical protein